MRSLSLAWILTAAAVAAGPLGPRASHAAPVDEEEDPDEPPIAEPVPDQGDDPPPPPAPDPATPTPTPEDRPPPTATVPAPPASDEAGDPATSGVSWTMMAAGVPERGGLLHGEVGFAGLPRIAYHHSLGGGLSIGGLAAFDYAGFNTKSGFDERLILAVPVRYSLPIDEHFAVGFRGDPGVVIPFDGGFGVQLDLQANAGWMLASRFIAGVGIDMPIALLTGGGATAFAWPILAGGFAELHVSPPLALTLDAKVGPYLSSASGVTFGMRVLAGLAYRL